MLFSFTPTAGPVGTAVTIYGRNLVGVSSLKLGTVNAAFTPINSSVLRATVPSVAMGIYRWQVTTPGGTATSRGAYRVR
jgi:hypothetical protein